MPSETISSDAPILGTDPFEQFVEQNFPALHDSHFYTKRVISLPLFVVAPDVLRNADLALTVQKAGEISDLQLSEHDYLERTVMYEYTPLSGAINA